MALQFNSNKPTWEKGFRERFVGLFEPKKDERNFSQRVRHTFNRPELQPQIGQ